VRLADHLTQVELTWVGKKIEHWVRFGLPAHDRILDRHRHILFFRPGTVFALVRNEFGAAISRLDIVATVGRDQAYQTLPCVHPGGDILLRSEGWPKVERVLQAIDAIERLKIDPEAVSPDYWRHVHNRLTAGQEPRGYSIDQHRGFLLRQRAAP
jgi:hypothetical protein